MHAQAPSPEKHPCSGCEHGHHQKSALKRHMKKVHVSTMRVAHGQHGGSCEVKSCENSNQNTSSTSPQISHLRVHAYLGGKELPGAAPFNKVGSWSHTFYLLCSIMGPFKTRYTRIFILYELAKHKHEPRPVHNLEDQSFILYLTHKVY